MLAHSPMLTIEAIAPTRIVSRVAASPQQIAKIAKALSPSFSGARMTCTAIVQHHVKQCTTSAPNVVTLGDERAVQDFSYGIRVRTSSGEQAPLGTVVIFKVAKD